MARTLYIVFTLLFLDNKFEMQDILLLIKFFPHPHTSERIQKQIELVVEQFELDSSKVGIVSDGDVSIIKAIKDVGFNQILCLAHRLHRLIAADVFPDNTEIQVYLAKCRRIYKRLNFRKYELKKKQQEIIERMESSALEQGFSWVFDHDPGLPPTQTRWNSVFAMVKSVSNNRASIRQCMIELQEYDLIIKDSDADVLEELMTILKPFMHITEVFSISSQRNSVRSFVEIKMLKKKLVKLFFRALLPSKLVELSQNGFSEVSNSIVSGLIGNFDSRITI